MFFHFVINTAEQARCLGGATREVVPGAKRCGGWQHKGENSQGLVMMHLICHICSLSLHVSLSVDGVLIVIVN